ncbi:uncharacterized protein ACA1_378260 [Acanthamoeba castellanii str. Neff]|uniref:Polymerase nucleotidyl transferase domain-containing protein n=1 Tax=Acanthamoeba castellanii (strain ATCC 30010 / Neff) TaxID=1257118 RepID=L8GS13_ACACF|nr:uncharacterized protein ACA1_378260 [Acanthamoeba castellanii str. Neff]ELR15707.1 hypothetical protein ACA1_378260 [Acanthamoeba castellanii str. Neff]
MEKQDEEVSPQELLKRVQVLLEGSPEVEAAQRETLRNVYVFGSRVHQCHQPDADYDLIAIVEGPYFEGPKLIEEGDLNVNLYHRVYFTLLLKECLVWCLLVLFLPRRFVLKEEIKLPWQMRKLNVRKSALLDSKHNLQKICNFGVL